jgi:hypothetical protein
MGTGRPASRQPAFRSTRGRGPTFCRKIRGRPGGITSAEATRDDKILTARSKVNEYLRVLGDAGVVECVEESRGNTPSRWRLIGGMPEAGAAWLPTLEALQ